MKTNENGLCSARCANHPLAHDRRGPFPKSKMEQTRRRHTHRERSKRRVQLQCLKIESHHKSQNYETDESNTTRIKGTRNRLDCSACGEYMYSSLIGSQAKPTYKGNINNLRTYTDNVI